MFLLTLQHYYTIFFGVIWWESKKKYKNFWTCFEERERREREREKKRKIGKILYYSSNERKIVVMVDGKVMKKNTFFFGDCYSYGWMIDDFLVFQKCKKNNFFLFSTLFSSVGFKKNVKENWFFVEKMKLLTHEMRWGKKKRKSVKINGEFYPLPLTLPNMLLNPQQFDLISLNSSVKVTMIDWSLLKMDVNSMIMPLQRCEWESKVFPLPKNQNFFSLFSIHLHLIDYHCMIRAKRRRRRKNVKKKRKQ